MLKRGRDQGARQSSQQSFPRLTALPDELLGQAVPAEMLAAVRGLPLRCTVVPPCPERIVTDPDMLYLALGIIGATLTTTNSGVRGEFTARGLLPLSATTGSVELIPTVKMK